MILTDQVRIWFLDKHQLWQKWKKISQNYDIFIESPFLGFIWCSSGADRVDTVGIMVCMDVNFENLRYFVGTINGMDMIDNFLLQRMVEGSNPSGPMFFGLLLLNLFTLKGFFMTYNLTKNQKEMAEWLVKANREERLPEEFYIIWSGDNTHFAKDGKNIIPENDFPTITQGIFDVLASQELIQCKSEYRQILGGPDRETRRSVVLLGHLYDAVDSGFDSPDMSFKKQLSPLADINNLDNEIKERCLPTLGADSTNPKLWDTAIRTAVVILEERLRDVGNISDDELIGQSLVNFIFKNDGPMANNIKSDSIRQGYRDLYAGIVGIFRNPYTHRFIDPSPEDGGEVIGFINLLLKMLEDLRQKK